MWFALCEYSELGAPEMRVTQRIGVGIQKADLGFEHPSDERKLVAIEMWYCPVWKEQSDQSTKQKNSNEFHSSSKWKSRKQVNFSLHYAWITLFLLLTQKIFLKESKIFCDPIRDNNYGNKLEIWGFVFFLSSLVKMQQRSEKLDTQPVLSLCKNAMMKKGSVFLEGRVTEVKII